MLSKHNCEVIQFAYYQEIMAFTNGTYLPDELLATPVNDIEVPQNSLDVINTRKTIEYAPVLGIYIFIMLAGLIGNSFVLYVYKVKFKRSSARTYILCLALMDFLVCCVGLPFHTLDLTHLLTYYNADVCRGLSYLSGAVNLGSVFLLMIVAVDRYLKVCRPLKKQVKDFGNRRACAIAIVCAIVFSIPNAILYGTDSVEISAAGLNLTGVQCFIDDEFAESTFAIAYSGFYIFIFVICVLTLIILYTIICREIYRNQADLSAEASYKVFCFCCLCADESNSDSESVCSGHEGCTETAMTTMTTEVVSEDKHGPQNKGEDLNTIEEVQHLDSGDESNPSIVSVTNKDEGSSGEAPSLLTKPYTGKTRDRKKVSISSTCKKQSAKCESRKQSKNISLKPLNSNALVRHTSKGRKEKKTMKITLMMMTITVVFILSYLPFIIISLTEAADTEYNKGTSKSFEIFNDFMMRFYLINSMANAIIYSFWDQRFRLECLIIIRKLFCCRQKKISRLRRR